MVGVTGPEAADLTGADDVAVILVGGRASRHTCDGQRLHGTAEAISARRGSADSASRMVQTHTHVGRSDIW